MVEVKSVGRAGEVLNQYKFMVRKKGLSRQEPNLGQRKKKEEGERAKDKGMHAAITHLVIILFI